MRSTHLMPIAMLAFAAACSDTTTSPTSVDRPTFLVTAGSYAGTLNTSNTPGGGHLQSGSINCVVGSDLSITCSSGAYQINGIGHTNATATLVSSYSATVDCTNKGGNLVEVKSTAQSAPVSSGPIPSSKNGSLVVQPISTSGPSTATLLAAATCPNGNWTKTLAGGTVTLESFTYTLTFAGFSFPAVSISAS